VRCEEGIVRGIRARIGVISEAACEAVRYCVLLERGHELKSLSVHGPSTIARVKFSVIKTFVL